MKKRMLSIVLIMVMLISLLTGCGVTEDSTIGKVLGLSSDSSGNNELALSVVVGMHSNAMEIPINSVSIKDAVYNSCYTYGSISFISVDGNPKVFYQADIPEPEVGGLTESKKESIANGYTTQLLNEIKKATPMVSEVDTLKAIQQAAFTLQGAPESADKVMIVMDTGLSTIGYLDFTKGLLDADVDSIVEALKKADAIPSLEGISVVWMFNGQTASPQQELSERQKTKLKEIWREILLAGGASEVRFTTDIASDISVNQYPTVSLVDVEERSIEVNTESLEPIEIVISEPIETVVLDNTSVQFVGDKAVFVNEELAMEHLETLAEELLKQPNNKVYVIGTTASGGLEFCNQLSIDRAQTVVNALIALGVPSNQLIPMGLGFNDPWHVDDLDANGRQIESQACQNRKVLIVDVNGNDAKNFNKESENDYGN